MIFEIKLLKGIDDTRQDELIELIVADSTARILAHLNYQRQTKLDSVPDDLIYIVRDVAVKRFNKLNSEGAKSDSEEGRRFEWEAGYLNEYLHILDSYKDSKAELGRLIVW